MIRRAWEWLTETLTTPEPQIPWNHPAAQAMAMRQTGWWQELEAQTEREIAQIRALPEYTGTRWRTVTTDWDHIDRIGD